MGLTREQMGFVPTSCHYFGVNCKQGLPDGNEARKATQGNVPTANVRPSQSSLSIKCFGGKGKREVGCGEGCL